MNLLVTLVNDFLLLTNVTKNSILDARGVLDSPLSLLGEFFPTCLSLRHIGQLVTHSETVRTCVSVSRSVMCKTIARKNIFSN